MEHGGEERENKKLYREPRWRLTRLEERRAEILARGAIAGPLTANRYGESPVIIVVLESQQCCRLSKSARPAKRED